MTTRTLRQSKTKSPEGEKLKKRKKKILEMIRGAAPTLFHPVLSDFENNLKAQVNKCSAINKLIIDEA